jgi:ABC-2 type transport system ATP-binding protein
LDPKGQREFKNCIHGVSSEGKTIVISTHMLEVAERHCTSVGIIDRGHIVATGKMKDIMDGRRGALGKSAGEKEGGEKGGGTLEEVFLKLTEESEEVVSPLLPQKRGKRVKSRWRKKK